MPNFENIEKISIPGAFETCDIAKMYIVSNDNTLCEKVQKEIIEYFNPERYTAPFSFEICFAFIDKILRCYINEYYY